MDKISAFVNKNWERLLKIFNIKIIKKKSEILDLPGSILIISEDKKPEILDILNKIEEKEIIVSEVPATKNSIFEIEDIQRLISKVLGVSTLK